MRRRNAVDSVAVDLLRHGADVLADSGGPGQSGIQLDERTPMMAPPLTSATAAARRTWRAAYGCTTTTQEQERTRSSCCTGSLRPRGSGATSSSRSSPRATASSRPTTEAPGIPRVRGSTPASRPTSAPRAPCPGAATPSGRWRRTSISCFTTTCGSRSRRSSWGSTSGRWWRPPTPSATATTRERWATEKPHSPGRTFYERVKNSPTEWHFSFHQVLDLPEALVSGTRAAVPAVLLRPTRRQAHRGGRRRIRPGLRATGSDARGFDLYRAFPAAMPRTSVPRSPRAGS